MAEIKIFRPGDRITGGPFSAALGYFDGVHIGHAKVIAEAKTAGGGPLVVTFLQHPCEILGGDTKKLLSDPLKEEVFAALGAGAAAYLDFYEIKDLSPREFVEKILIEKFNVKLAFCGFNYRFGRGAAAGPDELIFICKELGIEAFCVGPVLEGGSPVSSTRIRELIGEGKMKEAAVLLGRPYAVDFEVVRGRGLGKKLGLPTLNQPVPEDFVLPRFGVYASRVTLLGKTHFSVTNVGVKPTVGGCEPCYETHIPGFGGDLYGKRVKVELLNFLRDETRFQSVEKLREQIKSDISAAGLVQL